MAGNVKQITDTEQLELEISQAGNKLVVIDFYATWCGPCQRISPVVARYSLKFPNTVFLKVDVEQSKEVAATYNVTAMPTFVFIRQENKLDIFKGADPNALEDRIRQWGGAEGEVGSGFKEHVDLSPLIYKPGCECLNESDDHKLEDCLTNTGGYVESDCDEQLLITVAFQQAVKLHSLKIHGPKDNGPKTVKIFINQTKSPDFDSAESMEPVQMLQLTPEDLEEDALIGLRFVKYQNVSSVTFFIKDNQSGDETTQISYLAFIGSPVSTTTDMKEFKRVAGKKGESH